MLCVILICGVQVNMKTINQLPDEVLSHIVSFLRLKDAVDTRMLSRRWRHLWKHPTLTKKNLVFDIRNIFGDRYDQLVAEYEENDNIGMLDIMDEYVQTRIFCKTCE